MRTILVIYLWCLTGPYSFCQVPYQYTKPRSLHDSWTTRSIHDLRVDTSRVHQLFQQLSNQQHDIDGILVVYNNELIIEEYFNDYGPEKTHDLRSITKSIRSLLVGIAIDQGYISSVDDPIFHYLRSHKPRKNPDRRKHQITIEHLLTMSSGLDCNDWDQKSKGQEDKVYKKKDWIQYTLDLPMLHDPGSVSNYCSMGTILLSTIIEQASGMTIDEFARVYLFDPLGISSVNWDHTSKSEVISSAKRLHMTPRDMAKIGQLIINEGKWKDHQVVPAKWIRESTSAKTKISGEEYGYLWWNLYFPTKEGLVKAKTATGNGGQYIINFPEQELVVVFTGSAFNSEKDKIPFVIVKDVLLPSLL